MTRTGKIARLPASIRDQLNRRLLDNEPGPSLLDWLNSLPEVKATLAAQFASQPVSPANLTQWKNGGHRDWLARLDVLALTRDLEDKHAFGDESLEGPFTDKLARWLALHYASATLRLLAAEDADPDTYWRRLRQSCADVARLQREEHQAQRIDLQSQLVELRFGEVQRQLEKELHDAQAIGRALQGLMETPADEPPPAGPSPDP
jgi:hypothetical protein